MTVHIMDEKSMLLLNSFLLELPERYREIFRELGEYAISLGYRPKRTKSKDFTLDFSKNKVKRTILKMEVHDNGQKSNSPGLRLKFYATEAYSKIFRDGVQTVIEEFNGKYTGCYGCGRCKGKLEGYIFTYPDGKEVFRCGNELIAIHDFDAHDIPEIKALLKTQDEFFCK